MAIKKPQTEEKAKGLIGLKKGKKVEGAEYSVGNYKGKTLNLTKKQLGKAGTKAAAKRTVKIEDTKYEGKKVLGPGGKPLTGTVDLGGGNMAVYKNGVRVRAAKKVAAKPATGGGRSTGGGGGNTGGGNTGGGGGKGKDKGKVTSSILNNPARADAIRNRRDAAPTAPKPQNKNIDGMSIAKWVAIAKIAPNLVPIAILNEIRKKVTK